MVVNAHVQESPPPDDIFFNPRMHARRRLTVRLLQKSFGENHPVSRFASAYEKHDRRLIPTRSSIEDTLSEMEAAWEDTKSELNSKAEYLQDE